MFIYGRSEHKCLPNFEQDVLIGDNSKHISLPNAEQALLTDGSSKHICLLKIIARFIN